MERRGSLKVRCEGHHDASTADLPSSFHLLFLRFVPVLNPRPIFLIFHIFFFPRLFYSRKFQNSRNAVLIFVLFSMVGCGRELVGAGWPRWTTLARGRGSAAITPPSMSNFIMTTLHRP